MAVGLYGANEASKSSNKALKQQKKAQAAQDALMREQLQYTKEQDALKQGWANDLYNEQRGLAEGENARVYGTLDQMDENASNYYDELSSNAGLTYDELTGNAYDTRDFLSGNAQSTYDELMGNARYSNDEYLQAGDEASADVTQSFDKSLGTARRNAMRYGINPNSSAFSDLESGAALDQAKADAGAQNTTRRGMKREERGRVADAITAGRGAIDSAGRFGGTMVQGALTSGRSAIDSAIRNGRGAMQDVNTTRINVGDKRLGMNDPRLGYNAMQGSVMGAQAGTMGDRASNYGASASAYDTAALQSLSSGLKGAGTVIGMQSRSAVDTPTGIPPGGNYMPPDTGGVDFQPTTNPWD
jgi:hypothetical protein